MLKFSIIIPTYNRATHIKYAIESVIAQTYEEWELIIIDDGSTDDTCKICTSINDHRIKYIYQNNSERSAARNKGIDIAKGEWICFLDSDDYFLPNHLEQLMNTINRENLKNIMLASGLYTEKNGNRTKKELLNFEVHPVREISEKFLIPTQVCVSREILINNRFDENFCLWEDTHLWMRIAAQFPVIQINLYTAVQIHHKDSTVAIGSKKIKINDVNRYIEAIKSLSENYSLIFNGILNQQDFIDYADRKYRMYLYQARQKGQVITALKIWWMGLLHHPSLYLLSELPKIFINKIGIGIHV
jgi:glycosyltransferase involved in cell wall biosynthesis